MTNDSKGTFRWPSPRSTTSAARWRRRRRSTSCSPTTRPSPETLVGVLPAARAVGRSHDLDEADEHRALRERAAPDGRHARRRAGVVHQRGRGDEIRGRPHQGRHGAGRSHLPRQGRARRPLHRRPVDGGLRRGESSGSSTTTSSRASIPTRAPSASSTTPSASSTLGPEFTRIFGTKPTDGPDDPFGLVKKVDHGVLPKMRIDCGTEDFLLDSEPRVPQAPRPASTSPTSTRNIPAATTGRTGTSTCRKAIGFHARNLGLKVT